MLRFAATCMIFVGIAQQAMAESLFVSVHPADTQRKPYTIQFSTSNGQGNVNGTVYLPWCQIGNCVFELVNPNEVKALQAKTGEIEQNLILGLEKLDEDVYAAGAVERVKAEMGEKVEALEARIAILERIIGEMKSVK